MRKGLKDRIKFNPSNPSRMNVIKTDYLSRNSFNKRIGNAFCAPKAGCSNVQDASGFWVGTSQQNLLTQRQYYAPFRQPVKGYRKTLYCITPDDVIDFSANRRDCLSTTEIYKDGYANCENDNCNDNGSISTSTIPLTGSQFATRASSGNFTRTAKPIIRSGMQPNIAGKQNSGLSNTLTATRYSYSYRELINNRRKATQIKKLSTQKPTSSTYMSNPQKMPGYGGNCTEVDGCNPGETTYRYNNNKFATQGAVEASDRITRLKLDTIRGATNCPTGQTAQHTGTNCNGLYSTGNLQSSIRTNNWPRLSQTDFRYKNAQVKYNALFNSSHTEVNYPQVNALARVRGATKPKRRTNGTIVEDNAGVCPTNCGPQLLM